MITRSLHYIAIAAIHIGFLALPVGEPVRAAVITVQVGQHQTYLGHNRVEASPSDTDIPTLGETSLSVYQEDDWFDWPIYASDGTPMVDFQLVYDGRSPVSTPEISTWLMIVIAVLLLIIGKLMNKVLRLVKARDAWSRLACSQTASLQRSVNNRVNRNAWQD